MAGRLSQNMVVVVVVPEEVVVGCDRGEEAVQLHGDAIPDPVTGRGGIDLGAVGDGGGGKVDVRRLRAFTVVMVT